MPSPAAVIPAIARPVIAAVPGIKQFVGRYSIRRGTVNGEGVSVLNPSRFPASSKVGGFLKSVLIWAGISEAMDFIIPDSWIDFDVSDMSLSIGGGDDANHPARVVKTWENRYTNFVMLENGQLGAWKPSQNRWVYWRPKKPKAVIYSNGATDIDAFKRGGLALVKQAKDIQKVIDTVVPKKPAPRRKKEEDKGPLVVKEAGAGDLVVARR